MCTRVKNTKACFQCNSRILYLIESLSSYIIADCYNGQIRLVEGKDQYEGRLEVCYTGRWGTVGADEWTETNSRVVCNSLGYDYSGIAV